MASIRSRDRSDITLDAPVGAAGDGGASRTDAPDCSSADAWLRWATALAWIAVVAWGSVVFGRVLTHDFRTQPLAGDTASHLMQALSVSHDDHRLSFDGSDLALWKSMNWAAEPVGMFYQAYDDRHYGLAKPYGYSVYAAPFIAAFGPVHGMALANAVLLGLLILLSTLLLRTRYSGLTAAIAVAAFYLTSYAYMYAYWAHSELFLASVTLVALFAVVRFAQTRAMRWALLAFAVIGFGVSEKAAFATLFAPLAGVVLWRVPRWRDRFALSAACLVSFSVAVLPYLHYSDWQSITPYGGEHREYVRYATPFAGGKVGFADVTSFGGTQLWDRLTDTPGDKALAVVYTFVGRYTGLVVYIPVALLLLLAGVMRFRHADAWGRAAVLALLAYLGFYALFFPTNYFGGGQTLGNRYFLQVSPVVLATVVLVGVSRRVLLALSVAGAVLGIVLLWPQHEHPASAHVSIERTSPLQRVLPFESNQETVNYFRCAKRSVTHITVCELPASEG